MTILHLRRAMANHTECDPDDPREFADGPDDATCPECLYAYEKRKEEWYDDLAAKQRLKREPQETPRSKRDTKPGKGQR